MGSDNTFGETNFNPDEMETKHTPGPWFYVDFAGCFCIQDGPDYDANNLLDYSDTLEVMSKGKKINPITEENAKANAKIMIFAPDLLKVCIEAKQLLVNKLQEPERTVFWHLVDVINKATDLTEKG